MDGRRIKARWKFQELCHRAVFFYGIYALGIVNILVLFVPIERSFLWLGGNTGLVVRINGSLNDVLIIIMNCRTHKTKGLILSRLPAPAYELECNNETNWIDCHEAVPYLNFIIDHYDKPAAKRYVFIHGHEKAGHLTYGNSYFALNLLFGLQYFWETPYGGFCGVPHKRGPWGPGDKKSIPGIYEYVFNGTSMPPKATEEGNFYPCCATFFMDSDMVYTRTKEEYILIRDRLQQWARERQLKERSDRIPLLCGRLMEYNWHVLFTGNATVETCPIGRGAIKFL